MIKCIANLSKLIPCLQDATARSRFSMDIRSITRDDLKVLILMSYCSYIKRYLHEIYIFRMYIILSTRTCKYQLCSSNEHKSFIFYFNVVTFKHSDRHDIIYSAQHTDLNQAKPYYYKSVILKDNNTYFIFLFLF